MKDVESPLCPEDSPFLFTRLPYWLPSVQGVLSAYREESWAEVRDLDFIKSPPRAEAAFQGPGEEKSLPPHPLPFQRSQLKLPFSFPGTKDVFKQRSGYRVSFITRTPGNQCVWVEVVSLARSMRNKRNRASLSVTDQIFALLP